MQTPVPDRIVRQLLAGNDIETLSFYDVSDIQIYGRKHLRRLSGFQADMAQEVGCEPLVYQAVLWWCFVYIPIVPLKVYFVIPCLECDDPDDDAEQFRGVQAPWDSNQVTIHFMVTTLLLLAVAVCLFVWFG